MILMGSNRPQTQLSKKILRPQKVLQRQLTKLVRTDNQWLSVLMLKLQMEKILLHLELLLLANKPSQALVKFKTLMLSRSFRVSSSKKCTWSQSRKSNAQRAKKMMEQNHLLCLKKMKILIGSNFYKIKPL